jgi:hypothetical protein
MAESREPPQQLTDTLKATVPADTMEKMKSLMSKISTQRTLVNATDSKNAMHKIAVPRQSWDDPPHYFQHDVPLELLIERGNVLTAHTGCAIATWSYQGKRHKYRPLNDCRQHAKSADALKSHQVTAETASQVQAYDTVYVPICKLEHFVNTTLPNITKNFILMSGQNSKPPEPIPREVYNVIMKHPRIVKWFLQNLSMYAVDPHNPKLRPFPYGIHTMQPKALLEELKTPRNKTNLIYKSWFKKSNNWNVRRNIPNGEQVNATEFLKRMHESEYVISPDGDRPECHRHYEAIALGTMPITSLDPTLYRHLEGNVIYEETTWNLTDLEVRLPRKPVVNQRLIFQEYWMEYVEREVGRPLRWWDPSRDVRCSLAEITNVVKNISLSDVHDSQQHTQATNIIRSNRTEDVRNMTEKQISNRQEAEVTIDRVSSDMPGSNVTQVRISLALRNTTSISGK